MNSRRVVRIVRAISIPISIGMLCHASIGRSETLNEEIVRTPKRDGEASNINSAAPHDPDEIVVTAARRGEAEVAAQDEFGEEEIESRGADNIRDLIKQLSPFIGESGDDPLLLINGKPAGFDQSILYYPAEALERLAVLKPEAASIYGEPAGKPVVNLVLKKNFSMLNAGAGISIATAGGRYGGTFSAGRSAINGETRWNVQAQMGADSALFRSERNVPQKNGVFDRVGFLSSPSGGEIDAALSSISGKLVTIAAIPVSARSGVPGLTDFRTTAGQANFVDPNRFETLEASRRTASLAIGVTRPLGDFNSSVGLNFNRTSDKGLRGLRMASFVLPADSPWSPFSNDVLVVRPFSGGRALRNNSEATSFGATITLNGKIANWRTNLSLNYSRNWAQSLLESGIDIAKVEQAVGERDPDFNPYGNWAESLLLANWSETQGEIISLRLNAQRSILKLPAGPLTLSVNSNVNHSRSKGRQGEVAGGDSPISVSGSALRQASVQTSLSIPITRRGKTSMEWLGDLSASLSASLETLTNSRARKRFGGSIFWTPWSVLELRGSVDFAGSAPSADQISGPLVTSVVRVFDYSRQEVAEPIWVTGGNPELRLGNRRSFTLVSKIKPLANEFLVLNLTYRQIVAKGGIASFPDLTPAIEQAFPERITRDSDGRLIQVDARAVNLYKSTDAELSSSLAIRWDQGVGSDAARAIENPWQAALSIGHRWKLNSNLQARPGTPAIDQLRESGQSRHSLTFDASLGKRGIGFNFSGSWSSKSQLRSMAGAAAIYRFRPAWIFALSAFIEPERSMNMPSNSILEGVKISVDVQNLLDNYRRVLFEDGSVPAGYSRYEIDAVGRLAKLTVRKQF